MATLICTATTYIEVEAPKYHRKQSATVQERVEEDETVEVDDEDEERIQALLDTGNFQVVA